MTALRKLLEVEDQEFEVTAQVLISSLSAQEYGDSEPLGFLHEQVVSYGGETANRLVVGIDDRFQ